MMVGARNADTIARIPSSLLFRYKGVKMWGVINRDTHVLIPNTKPEVPAWRNDLFWESMCQI